MAAASTSESSVPSSATWLRRTCLCWRTRSSIRPGNATTYAFNLADGPSTYVSPDSACQRLLPATWLRSQPKSRPNTLRLPTVDAWNLAVQRSITSTLSVTMAYVGNKSTHTLGAGDSNNTNPNEAGINLPAQYSVVGAPLHGTTAANALRACFPAVERIAADGGTKTGKYLQRYYGGTLAACQDPAYSYDHAAVGDSAFQPEHAAGTTASLLLR